MTALTEVNLQIMHSFRHVLISIVITYTGICTTDSILRLLII